MTRSRVSVLATSFVCADRMRSRDPAIVMVEAAKHRSGDDSAIVVVIHLPSGIR